MADKSNDADRRSWLYHPRFPPDWSKGPLYPLATWINGMAFRNINFSDTGRPVIKIAEIKNGITAQTRFTEAAYDESYFITEGDMLFSWSGQPETSIDVFWWRGPDGWLNQHIFKVLPNTDLCLPEFFYYLLRYLNPNFVAIARNKQTTGLGHVTKRDLEAIEVAWPPKPLQQAIACILGTLDDKIELNRRMNETLEGMAQAIFKSWFVNFDPVRAKASGQQPSGLAPHIADFFPDAYQASELGEIPKGWAVGTIKDCCVRIQNGGTPKRNEPTYWEPATIPWLTSGEVRQTIVVETDNRISEIGLRSSSAKWLPVDSTVVALYGATAGQVSFVAKALTTNQAVCGLAPEPNYRYFNYLWLAGSVGSLANLARGSAQQNISKGIVEATRVVLPSKDVLGAFEMMLDPIFKKWVANLKSNITLAALRDAILPKLISGELRIPDAERLLEDNL